MEVSTLSTLSHSKELNRLNGIEKVVEKEDIEENKDTKNQSVGEKDREIGYKRNKEDCGEKNIEVHCIEDLGKLSKDDGAPGAENQEDNDSSGIVGIGIGSGSEEKNNDTILEKEAHRHLDMPKGWTAVRDPRGKQKQKQKHKHKTGEGANGNTHTCTHTQADMTNAEISKSQEDGNHGGVVEGEIEDLDDLDLMELNSGDDLLPDEEEGGIRRGGNAGNAARRTGGAADEGLERGRGRGSTDRDTASLDTGHFRVYKRRWFGLIQLVLLNIIVSWDWLTFSASSTTVSQYYNVSESAINWLSTGFLFAFVLASPLVIYVLHHGGPKPAILIASVLLLLGNWIRYGATRSGPHGNFGGVMFGQILTGVAQPFVLAAPTRYSDLWFTNQGRVAATAVMSLANPFGGALAQLIDPFWAANAGSIPNMVLYIAIISSIATIPSFFIPKEPPTPSSASSEEPKHALGPSLNFLLRSPEFYMIMFPFWFFVGLFNSLSSLINQMLSPYSFSETNAGIAGALLIVVGLVAAAITSPLIDKTKTYLLAIKIQIPILSICYLAFTWAPQTRNLAAIYAILSILGAASFSLVPVALEYLIEITHPVSPEVTSTICWSGGQLLGGVFIIVSDKLRAKGVGDGSLDDGSTRPPGNMYNALVFQAVLAAVVMPLPLALGCCGRGRGVRMRRLEADKEARGRRVAGGSGGENGIGNGGVVI
ncbi:caa1c0b2-ed93-46c1-9f55-059eb5529149 [Sclerotinia trifoliorum]|uniref:Caa1c0b2-ed93-46c1-9f55-059eb5529149 n=1 Tax=Sclerotinia trifoliorum TaxID=28548 RepID=A0A8H2VLJ2_9HELO|nr:caa1c0b2-ed93-46c1-9f55-059eb5529149 [Sclerotinia trifoliorum]